MRLFIWCEYFMWVLLWPIDEKVEFVQKRLIVASPDQFSWIPHVLAHINCYCPNCFKNFYYSKNRAPFFLAQVVRLCPTSFILRPTSYVSVQRPNVSLLRPTAYVLRPLSSILRPTTYFQRLDRADSRESKNVPKQCSQGVKAMEQWNQWSDERLIAFKQGRIHGVSRS